MSGEGPACAARSMPKRERGLVLVERDSCIAFVRAKAAEVRSIERKGQCDKESADLLVNRLVAIADSIGAGLHLGEPR